MRQPLADSEEVLRLRTRLQESDKMLQSAEQQINELETRSESWRQEVPGYLFLNVVSYMVPSDLREGNVDDSRKRITAAVRQSGTKSRLGGNFSS